ncbi:hypothetical protein [Nostoc sp.]|uniref:hypothetical protein n=1 Tax=Nostoc sp. TaxID=1180 RepID=UPI002FFC8D88
MHSETERIFRVLESYNANLPDDQKFWNNLFLWNSEQQGKFNIWKLLVSQGFVGSTKIDRAIQHWQDIESRGTPTVQEPYQYAPYWRERKYRVPSYVLKQRANVYQALAYFIKQNLQNLEVYEISDSRHTDYHFRVYIILGQTLDLDWLCLMPTVPDQVRLWYNRSLCANLEVLAACKSKNSNTQDLFEKVNKILARLEPIIIYGYYYGGYNYTYKHQILCTISSNKTKAIKLGLKASGMFAVDKSLSEMISYPKGEQVRQFMQETLQGCRRYMFSFWESGYAYDLGYTQTGDWLGFKHWFWCEYNP